MSFGSRLKERRESLGLTQTQLGKMIGVTGSAVANYENEFSSPKADVLYQVFDALQCDANYLFQDEMSDIPEIQSTSEHILLTHFRRLNEEGQEKVISYASDLSDTGKYIKSNKPLMGEEA